MNSIKMRYRATFWTCSTVFSIAILFGQLFIPLRICGNNKHLYQAQGSLACRAMRVPVSIVIDAFSQEEAAIPIKGDQLCN